MSLATCSACGLRTNTRKMLCTNGKIICADLLGCEKRQMSGEVFYQAIQDMHREEMLVESAMLSLDAGAASLLG